jgi:hypothetical protein
MQFEDIASFQAEDAEQAASKLLDLHIADLFEGLHLIESEQINLEQTLADLTEKANGLNLALQNTSELESCLGIMPLPVGTFFQQLRNFDAVLEHQQNEKVGYAAVLHSLKSHAHSFEAKNRRLVQKSQQSREQYDNSLNILSAKRKDVEGKHETLIALGTECSFLKHRCESTKARIVEVAIEMQESSPEQIAFLLAQKAGIESELHEEKNKLEQLKQDQKAMRIQSSIQTTKINKELGDTMSAGRWFSKRSSLLARIRKTRQELENLKSREKSATRTRLNCQTKLETLAYNADDVKRAITAEISALPMEAPQFLRDSLWTEQRHEKTLKQQITEIETLEKTIATFKSENRRLANVEEGIAAKNQRIALLMDELKEIRAAP